MELALSPLFEALSFVGGDRLVYSVAPIPEHPDYFVGKDNNANACLLIAVTELDKRQHAPIRLESLEVMFEVPSLVKAASKIVEGTYTVVRCRSDDRDIIRYFLSIAETLLRVLGPRPRRAHISSAVNRFALIFQRMQSPPTRPVNGLFGELFLIRQSRNPARLIAAWRPETASRFDFTAGDVRLDVKAATGRARVHTFSHDQCNPPPGTVAIAASLFVERTDGGVSLRELIREIGSLIGDSADLTMKLHDIVAETLGSGLQEALNIRFDQRLAASSLQFFDLRSIPAIRGDPPAGVSDIHFRSDVSSAAQAPIVEFARRQPILADFLPQASTWLNQS